MSTYLYVLELENGKYYVGKTKCLANRLAQHRGKKGAKWTKRHKPIGNDFLETRIMTYPSDEASLTRIYMKRYGIDNVRGGPYVTIRLNQILKRKIEGDLEIISSDTSLRDAYFRVQSRNRNVVKEEFVPRNSNKPWRKKHLSFLYELCRMGLSLYEMSIIMQRTGTSISLKLKGIEENSEEDYYSDSSDSCN